MSIREPSTRCAESSRHTRRGPWSGRGSTPTMASVYPSVRRFPVLPRRRRPCTACAVQSGEPLHQALQPGRPRRHRSAVEADWISGSCFLARRGAIEELGGFDEAYFMYAEDMDLCWRAHQAGWGIGFTGAASVTHMQGVSTARHPYRMMAGAPSFGLAVHRPDHIGLAAGAASPGRAGPRSAHGDRHGAPGPAAGARPVHRFGGIPPRLHGGDLAVGGRPGQHVRPRTSGSSRS